MYGLTHAAIVDALLAANLRGVDVALKTDKIESAGRTQSAMIAKLQAAGLPVEVSEQSRLLHHKFAVMCKKFKPPFFLVRAISSDQGTVNVISV
jgi:phosphatidylserine/phosphatidylglycerophosphate/cardiolipin synthase-like enzyme